MFYVQINIYCVVPENINSESHWKFQGRGEVVKTKSLKESTNLNWNFQRIFFLGGGQTKNSSMEGVWIFSGGTHLLDRSCQTAIQTCCD